MKGYIAEIRLFAGKFAPRGWAFCNGQILSIAQNTALFSLLGTTFGGNGQTTFALPDLRGRMAVGPGQGPTATRRKSRADVGRADAHPDHHRDAGAQLYHPGHHPRLQRRVWWSW